MSQFINEYLNFKQSYPDSLLFCRLGSFYELYFDDAILVARELGIALNHKKIAQQQIPTCGFPAKSLAFFSNKILQLGFKIVIAEQFIDPQNPENITRRINKILTPGTFVDEELLLAENILLAIVQKNNPQNNLVDLCFGNILLGDFYVDEIEISQINQYLETIKPVEILLEDKIIIDEKFHSRITLYQPNSDFKLDQTSFKTLSKYHNLALRNIFSYVGFVHNSSIFNHFKIYQNQNPKYLKIDLKTINNLELRKIISIVDRTNCQIGKRFLQSSILKPLACARQINDRLDGVECLVVNNSLLKHLQNNLKTLADLEKLIGRIVLTKNSNISDLSLIMKGLGMMVKIDEILFWQNNSQKLPKIFAEIRKKLFSDVELIGLLESAINSSVLNCHSVSLHQRQESSTKRCKDWIPAFAGMTMRGDIKSGFNIKLDHYKNLQREILQKISVLEIEYQKQSNVKNLKIEFNSLLGFYFEIKRDKASKIDIPQDWQLLQNLNNSIRFSSEKLRQYQLENADLEIKIKAIEIEIIKNLARRVIESYKEIKDSCKAIGMLDLLVSFAVVAVEKNYVKPIINHKNKIEIRGGKHFIDEKFVVNDCVLGEEKIWLITGANMAGKSTFLKQNALIVLLAQAGCFVPASYVEIGVRKKIFSKILVNDNLARNQSSFMVEMLEIAEILKNADENSLIIIDELCQTTNAIEGEKIAFGIINYLLKHNKSLALISSHQSNLVFQCQDLENIICKKIDKEHRMQDGIARKSSTMNILTAAGFPQNFVINH